MSALVRDARASPTASPPARRWPKAFVIKRRSYESRRVWRTSAQDLKELLARAWDGHACAQAAPSQVPSSPLAVIMVRLPFLILFHSLRLLGPSTALLCPSLGCSSALVFLLWAGVNVVHDTAARSSPRSCGAVTGHPLRQDASSCTRVWQT